MISKEDKAHQTVTLEEREVFDEVYEGLYTSVPKVCFIDIFG